MIDYLKRLFGIKVDPTANWPELPPSTPVLDLRTMQIGPLKFWDPIAKARELGRPDVCQRVAGRVDELLFARAGYLLEFYRGRFSYAAYFIGEDDHEDAGREYEQMVYSRPKMVLLNGEAAELGPELELELLVTWLGKPHSADVDEAESIILWRKDGVTIEAELNARGRLKRFNLYPTSR